LQKEPWNFTNGAVSFRLRTFALLEHGVYVHTVYVYLCTTHRSCYVTGFFQCVVRTACRRRHNRPVGVVVAAAVRQPCMWRAEQAISASLRTHSNVSDPNGTEASCIMTHVRTNFVLVVAPGVMLPGTMMMICRCAQSAACLTLHITAQTRVSSL
jgi:hypothetical protein